ncbi:DUF4352 domain-containing protein [Candidatus Bathyarchaeota archaeon]|nr:MAG: DUF4352 domain-containing protein [Candidatus Bathyarchaeota archaeon]
MRRSILLAILIITLVIGVSIGFSVWLNQHYSSQSATQPNDTTIGVPPDGYVYVDFSLLIMNCGYSSFRVAPSLFLLKAGGTTYPAASATANLPNRMNDTVLLNGQETFGEIAYEIPANQIAAIPSSGPLNYTLSQGYAIRWVSNW